MNNSKSNKLNGYFEVDTSYENDTWLKTKVRTFAFGKNANNSDIIPKTFSEGSNAVKSIGGIPIVAKYNTESDNLEGHNVELRKDKNGDYEIYHDTEPLGFTSPFAKFYTEEVNEGTDIMPEYKTYVVVEDVYLWKRYDATKKILEWFEQGISPKVSMEIKNVVGSFNSEGYFEIQDFSFDAICALGTDVTPCFPQAEIQTYSISDFKNDLKQLMYELESQSNSQEGGNNVTEETVQVTETDVEITEESTQEEVTEQEFEVTETTEELETSEVESTEVTEEFEVATVTEEVTKTEVETIVTTIETEGDTTVADLVGSDKELRDVEVVDYEAFALTHGQLADQLRGELRKEKAVDSWGDTYRKYWYVDSTPTHVIFENVGENYQLYQATYTLNGDNVVIDFTTAVKVKIEYVPFVEGTVQPTFERIESINAELEELKTFKRNIQESELASKFEGQLTEDELKEVFTNSKDSKLEDIEKELFALVGKKNFSLSQEKESVKVQIVNNKEESKINNPYKNFFE